MEVEWVWQTGTLLAAEERTLSLELIVVVTFEHIWIQSTSCRVTAAMEDRELRTHVRCDRLPVSQRLEYLPKKAYFRYHVPCLMVCS